MTPTEDHLPKLTLHFLQVPGGRDELDVWFDLNGQFTDVQLRENERNLLLLLFDAMVKRTVDSLPPPRPPATNVNFLKALDAAFQDGKQIKRRKWQNGTYGVLKDGQLQICLRGELHPWTLHENDYASSDWEVVE